MTWYMRHRPKGDARAQASVVPIEALTPGEAVDKARIAVPEGHVISLLAPY
ncbi:hypothetical protein [Frondihabitans sp. VKM Ac-2883]|uniref:hypothetical protein n=1 Tax=Frondihabitans sp. VKM Ac-2883 TaxID=2783823 RepID=UPI00188CD5D4|nr:hypothetical protein [Frondihabitans sp. VKM Ac-2883]MBF4577542.1 hypothetical protein [Frondihabitans sp. VKM Ac-2883]